jgi:hypothetical protein
MLAFFMGANHPERAVFRNVPFDGMTDSVIVC